MISSPRVGPSANPIAGTNRVHNDATDGRRYPETVLMTQPFAFRVVGEDEGSEGNDRFEPEVENAAACTGDRYARKVALACRDSGHNRLDVFRN